MLNNIIYIINNKLYNSKYLLYSIIFYTLICHSYFILYNNLSKYNYTVIFLYFFITMLSYIKYKRFGYVIGYVYLLVTTYFVNNIIESLNLENTTMNEGESLRDKVKSKRNNIESEIKANDRNRGNEKSTPCETYILQKMSERKSGIKSTKYSNNQPRKKIDINMNVQIPSVINAQVSE